MWRARENGSLHVCCQRRAMPTATSMSVLCVHRRDKGITVLWVMDLEYTISTHSSLFILCCQGHRKPLHYLYISLLLRLGLSFSLLRQGGHVALSPRRERAGERVNVSQGCCCERLIWETEWMRVYCQTVIQLVCSSSKPSQNIKLLSPHKSRPLILLTYGLKSRLWFVLERWKLNTTAIWSGSRSFSEAEYTNDSIERRKQKPCYYNLWGFERYQWRRREGDRAETHVCQVVWNFEHQPPALAERAKHGPLFTTGVAITLGSSHKWLEEIWSPLITSASYISVLICMIKTIKSNQFFFFILYTLHIKSRHLYLVLLQYRLCQKGALLH